MAASTKFTRDELAVVQKHYRTHSHAKIAKMVGRSHASIRNLCSDRGWICRDDYWSDQEIAKLIAWYQRPGAEGRDTLHLQTLAAELGREKQNVCRKARALGLTNKNRKVKTDESRKKHSEQAKKYIRENGHPKGALGIRHSPETRKVLGEKSRKSWEHQKKRPILMHLRRVQTVQTNLQRYGVASPVQAINSGRNVYSRCKRGFRDDIGFFVRSRWEANYARYLMWLQNKGEILSWEYEPTTFRFDGVARGPYTYKPDFLVVEKDGRRAYHEVKGWMDSASRSRLKRFAKFFPEHAMVVVDGKAYRQIQAKLSSVIPNWESE